MNRLAQRKDEAATLWFLPQKRSRNPPLLAFGHRLLELRGKRSRQQIANRLADLGAAFDASSLFQYEAGAVWAPDVGVLWGLSKIYEVALDELVTLLRENRKRTDATAGEWRDLLRQGRAGQPRPRQETAADSSVEARVRELEARVVTLTDEKAAYASIIKHAYDLAQDLGASTAVIGRERSGARRQASTRSRGSKS